jgi:hypothetical protein
MGSLRSGFSGIARREPISVRFCGYSIPVHVFCWGSASPLSVTGRHLRIAGVSAMVSSISCITTINLL